MARPPKQTLDPGELQRRIFKRLTPLNKLTFLEQYAMFMGKAQIVELGMKRILRDTFGYDDEELARRTLGQTVQLLKKEGMRPDFVALLECLVGHRNELAHDFLASDALGKSLVGAEFERLSMKQLRHALYKVEEVIQVHDHLQEFNLW